MSRSYTEATERSPWKVGKVSLETSLSLLRALCCMRLGRLRLKCDGTRAETRFCLSAKRTSPFKSSGALVQSTTGSRDVRISSSNSSNVGYTMLQRWCEGYWLPTPFASFPFTSPPVRRRVPSRFSCTLLMPTNPKFLSLYDFITTDITANTMARRQWGNLKTDMFGRRAVWGGGVRWGD